MFRYSIFIFMILFLTLTPSSAQLKTRYQDMSNADMVDALQFGGIEIFKFNIDPQKKNYYFFITVDEYDSVNGLRRIDTLLTHQTLYHDASAHGFIDHFRFITRVLNNDFHAVYVHTGTTQISSIRTLNIPPQFARKHYWLRFADHPTAVGKSIPLLLFGSEWIESINGVQTARFCNFKELNPALMDPTIRRIPHYFIISYELR